MSRAKRLQPVLKIADMETRKAARKLTWMRQKLAREDATLRELQNYRGELHDSLREQTGKHTQVQRLRLISAFAGNLENAIQQQQRQIEMLSGHLEQLRGEWQRRDRRARQLEKMVGRIEAAERLERQRQEQRTHYEYAHYSARRSRWQ